MHLAQSDLSGHAAVQAWSALHPSGDGPQRVEVLKARWSGPGTMGRIVCRLVDVGRPGSTAIGKRCPPSEGAVERIVYEDILPRLPITALRCYGLVEEEDGEFCWLFLEDAGENGGALGAPSQVAISTRWLSDLHASASKLDAPRTLADKGPAHYLALLRLVREAMRDHLGHLDSQARVTVPLRAVADHLGVLEAQWEQLQARCDPFPRTLVHGDFVPKNFRVRGGGSAEELLVFDWTEAGWGVPAVDLIAIDVPEYSARIRESWPWLDDAAIAELAHVGAVFRTLDAITWALHDCDSNSIRERTEHMGAYQRWLARAMRALRLRE
jgi:hypothetical protein